MVTYRYLGSATTGANGVAKYNFTGSGAGEIDYIASLDNPISSGSIVSETLSVEDYDWYDKGTLPINNPWLDDYNRATFVRNADGTSVTNTANNYTFIIANKSGTTSADYDFDTPSRIEFDYTNNNQNITNQIQIYDANNGSFNQNLINGKWIINIEENRVSWSVSGVDKEPKVVSLGKYFLRIQVPVGSDFLLQNFKIYSL